MKPRFAFFFILFLLFALAPFLIAQAIPKIIGTVRDSNGEVVAGALVQFIPAENPNTVSKTATDESGRFVIDRGTSEKGRLIVEAAGFTKFERQWLADEAVEVNIVLSPKPISAEVTITRIESRLEDTPASIVAIDSSDLSSSGAQTLDDKLRQVPGFSLFRRAGSRTANPTTQGVSLRGIGASGASRALVLWDGVPLNDPFGGWIYWGRVPLESIAEVEILRGPASDLYGSSAIGGVITVTRRRPDADSVLGAELSYGSMGTPSGSGFAFRRIRNWAGSIGAEAFSTRGFITVDKDERGSIDVPANSQRVVFDPEISYELGNGKRIFASSAFYGEKRGNGTPLQANDTQIRNIAVGADWKSDHFGELIARAYAGSQFYHQSFSAVPAARNSETLLLRQSVPAQIVGANVLWNANFRKQFAFFAGLEGHETRGFTNETSFSNSRPSSLLSAGGRELTLAGFGCGVIQIASRVSLSGGLRLDTWRNFSAYSATRSLATGQTVTTVYPERSESAFSPRAAVLFKLSDNISASALFATGFRQPTLNELYRSFRVGNVLTLANDKLRAERAVNGEAGIIVTAFDRRFFSRGNFFCTEVLRPVANVTLSVTPSLITRQRQNLGRTRSCGVELDADMKLSKDLKFSTGYLFVDSRIVSFPANVSLENLRIPQVARHQFSFQAQYSNDRIVNAGLQLRASSLQFDDDQNLLKLSGYFTVNASVSRRLNRWFSVFAALENLFNSRIESSRTPVLTFAAPRTARVGLRFSR